MKSEEFFTDTFKAMRHELGHDRAGDARPLWQRRLSCESPFCRALVVNGYLSQEQMQRAALRYRLGMSRDGGVIFWQIDEHDVTHDGKIMYYREDCHRDHDRKPSWVSYQLRRAGMLPQDWKSEHCLFGLHQLAPHTAPEGASLDLSAESMVSPSGDERGACIVESEKTAVDERGETYRDWYDIAEAAGDVFGHPVTVSSLLERRATKAQKAAKIDLADLFFPQSKV